MTSAVRSCELQRLTRRLRARAMTPRAAAVCICLLAASGAGVLPGTAAAAATVGEGGLGGIRIVPNYHSSVQRLNREQQTLLKGVLLNATFSWLKSVLKVRPETSPLAFERSCVVTQRMVRRRLYCVGACSPATECGPYLNIPEQHLQPCRSCQANNCTEAAASSDTVGVARADLVVYVSAITDGVKCLSQVVYGSHCQQEREMDRPTAAWLNICPSFLVTSSDFYHLQVATLTHHLLRIMAFSKSLFPFFRDEAGDPRNERDLQGIPLRRHGRYISDGTVCYFIHVPWETARNWTHPQDHAPVHYVKMVITPNVVREVQSHFGCSDMIGGELESQTPPLSDAAESLWEKRVFGEELMTASASYHPVVSRVSLALLHDSGWYLPDYSYGASLHWGRGQGCGFIQGSCYKWVWPGDREEEYSDEGEESGRQGTNIVPFCRRSQESAEGCVDQRLAVGVCSIKNYPARLPQEFQYFFTRRRGGSSALVDFCPIFQYDFYHSIGRSCVRPSETTPPLPEVYGDNSRCFEHQWDNEVGGAMGRAGCYTFSCTTEAVVVNVGGSEVNCSHQGEEVAVEWSYNSTTYHGHIVCPPYQDLCENYNCPGLCGGHGNCHQGQCKCQPGYYGDDCRHTYLGEILTCDEVVCENGGSCVTGASGHGFSCSCAPGFTGMLCERLLVQDPCQNHSCPGNRICVRTGMGMEAKCECHPEYGGEDCNRLLLCEQMGKKCLHGNCQRGHNGEPKCVCDDGYVGRLCHRSDDPCLFSPCLNSGECSVDLTQGRRPIYKCSCPPGFKGRRCGKQKNPCLNPNPCRNGGWCHQTMRGHPLLWYLFSCTCLPGFTGELCDSAL